MNYSNLRARLPGLALVAAIAIAATSAAASPLFQKTGLSTLSIAILLGMVLANLPSSQSWLGRGKSGIDLARGQLLRAGIMLYGFRLTFQDVDALGISAVLVDLCTLSSTFLIAWWAGTRWFKLEPNTAILIGAGSSICGAAAVLATEPVVRARADEVSVAVATVVLFGTLAMILYPALYPVAESWGWLPAAQSQSHYGIFIGSTVHEVAQVVAAARQVGPEAANAAVITKMVRVMMLAPFLMLLGSLVLPKEHKGASAAGRSGGARFPLFALGFVATTALNSTPIWPHGWNPVLITIDNALLAMAMAGLGLATHAAAIRHAGLKPILLAGVLFLWLLSGGAWINHLLQA